MFLLNRLFILFLTFTPVFLFAQDAADIIQQAEEHFRGDTHIATVKMTIERESWSREMTMKSWTLGEDYALILIESPARDKGTSFLKRDKEIWNWVPSIERVVKLPPSMMMQSWMGSDFTNDDLVRSSSIIEDYDQEIVGEEQIGDYLCYKIELTPKVDAAVVWGKIVAWISKEGFLQLKNEFYDEDEELVSVMEMSEVKEMDGRLIPTKMVMTPVDEEGERTIIEYLEIDFDATLEESMFSKQQMKRLK